MYTQCRYRVLLCCMDTSLNFAANLVNCICNRQIIGKAWNWQMFLFRVYHYKKFTLFFHKYNRSFRKHCQRGHFERYFLMKDENMGEKMPCHVMENTHNLMGSLSKKGKIISVINCFHKLVCQFCTFMFKNMYMIVK